MLIKIILYSRERKGIIVLHLQYRLLDTLDIYTIKLYISEYILISGENHECTFETRATFLVLFNFT